MPFVTTASRNHRCALTLAPSSIHATRDLRHETLNLAGATVPRRHPTLPPSQCRPDERRPFRELTLRPGRSHHLRRLTTRAQRVPPTTHGEDRVRLPRQRSTIADPARELPHMLANRRLKRLPRDRRNERLHGRAEERHGALPGWIPVQDPVRTALHHVKRLTRTDHRHARYPLPPSAKRGRRNVDDL